MRRSLAGIGLATLLAGAGFAQLRDVEVHASAPNTIPEMRARFWRGHYELRNATLVDLIRTAWNVEADNVVGGPEWLDMRRFDVIATAPADSTPEMLRTMLQPVLKDRFQLIVRDDKRDLPAYAITAGKKLQLKATDESETSRCTPQPVSNPGWFRLDCRNTTMTAFAVALAHTTEAQGYLFNYPVLDQTGIKGTWDFSVTWSTRRIYVRPIPAGETTSLFDALDKQLGLKLNRVKTSTPVIVVDRVSEPRVSPTRQARPEFEVADIKPDDSPEPCSNVGVQPGGRVHIRMSLKGLVEEAWGLHPNRVVGGPKSPDSGCWQVLAKAPVEEDAVAGWNGPVWNGVDIDSMRMMLRALLMDRFLLVAHNEDRPIDGYALVAARPKLRKADASSRAGCREGPGADGKDPRLANPVASRLVTCRNMTLSQYAGELHDLLPGDVPVVDATGIVGRFDMTINFSPPAMFQNAAPPDANRDGGPSIPDGAISHFDALRSQLGLKLEPRKVMATVLVIDSVNEKPTAN